uniref:uncharacterized protein LOC120348014 isoform X1 n=2 Tax=Styela clava TaxID=7725 RepID=UPI0019392B3F|nr:uncharacterized protein LOC120348014 isoform X1 [Styela clava]
MISGVNLFLILLSFIAWTSTASESQICYLPQAMELDVEMLPKTSWYSGLHTDDITASMLSCIRLNNFTCTASGFGLVSKEHGVRYVEFEFHFEYDGDGIYHPRKSDAEYIHAEHEKEMNGLDKEVVVDMDNFLINGKAVFLTDYKNYLAILQCPRDGSVDKEYRLIRGFFPSSNPDLSQVAVFINALHEMGISAKFYASTCSETDWSHEK